MPRTHRTAERGILIATFLAAIGCAAVALWPMPTPAPVRAARSLRSIGADERKAMVAFQKIYQDLQDGASPESAADRIDHDVLPVWRRAWMKAETVAQGPLSTYIPDGLAEYFRQREIAWRAMSKALRDDDPLQALRCRRAWREANKMADKINASRH